MPGHQLFFFEMVKVHVPDYALRQFGFYQHILDPIPRLAIQTAIKSSCMLEAGAQHIYKPMEGPSESKSKPKISPYTFGGVYASVLRVHSSFGLFSMLMHLPLTWPMLHMSDN